ncbi:FTR1 family iron permease [Parapusillimonas sp. SGNA-6]|nr:FTR1 family iron permease [Parapusillimonas sp. SGNA-6]
MEQVAFIVWRESVEALLLVGILYAWLRQSPEGRRGLPWLWTGVAGGLLLAGLLALLLLGLSQWLSSEGQELFQAAMAFVASALVVQMVYWMRRHGRTLKKELEEGAGRETGKSHWWGLLLLVAIAVAREGSETVVFLYGMISAGVSSGSAWKLGVAGLAGFIAALGTFWILQLGGKVLTWRRFFRLTETLLLLLASSLLVTGTDRLISLGILPAWIDPVWDSSAWLGTEGGLGKVLADFAGYRAYPALSQLLIWTLYWVVVWALLRRTGRRVAARANPSSVSA